MSYNYSMNIPLDPRLSTPTVKNGEVVKGADGYRILTTEDEAFRFVERIVEGRVQIHDQPGNIG